MWPSKCGDSRLDCPAARHSRLRRQLVESSRRERPEIITAHAVDDDFRHYQSRDRREQNAIAKVSCSDIVPGSFSGAKNGESIRSAGTKSGPVLENFGILERRDQVDSGTMQALNRGRVGAFVEARLFDRGANDDASIAEIGR